MSQPVTSDCHWPGMFTQYALVAGGGPATRTDAGQVGVAFSGHRGLIRETCGRDVRCDTAPGVVYVTGPTAIVWREVREPTEALEVYPDPDLVTQVAGTGFVVEPAHAVTDGVVFAAASRLRAHHLGVRPMNDVEGSALAHRLAQHLVGRYAGVGVVRERGGRLSAAQIDVVAEYVRANTGRVLSLGDLASVVSVSKFHFARAFRASTGVSAHQFVTGHRLMIGRDLLLRTALPVADVARTVGYSNVSHFRRMFAEQYGYLPGALRSRPA